MLTTNQLERFSAHIEKELTDLLEWVDAPEIKGVAKKQILLRQQRLEAAFLRIQRGVFGLCCDCRNSLALTELEADPAIQFCVYCLEKNVRSIQAS
jgi:DnaK suppressor protein